MMVGKHQSVYWGKIHWHSTSPLQRPWPSGEQTPWNPNSRSGLPRFICDVSQKEMYHVGACWSHSFGSVLIDVCLSCDSCDLKTTIVSPIEFQVRRCDPWSVCYKKDSQAWGYRMRLLSSIFPQHSLSYKMPLRFNNLDIGGGFPLLQNAPSFSTIASYKDIPFHFQGLHMQRNIFATKCNVVFNDIHQYPSSIIVHYSSQMNTDHASSCLRCFSKLRFGPYYFATKCSFDLISQHEAHHVMLQNATAIFMMG